MTRSFLLAAVIAGLAGCAHRPWDRPSQDWKQVVSEHFVVNTDADRGDYEPVIQRLEDVYRALALTYFEGTRFGRAEVLLFADEGDFAGVAGDDDIAGFFAYMPGRPRGLLVFSLDAPTSVVDRVAAHELAHRFMAALAPRVPRWFNEGFAQYAGGLQIVDEYFVFDMGMVTWGATGQAEVLSLDQLFRSGNAPFHSAEASRHYTTSWLLMRRLLSSGMTTAAFRDLVLRLQNDPSPEGQAAAVSAALAAPIGAIDREIQSQYAAYRDGIGQPRSRSARAIPFPPRPAATLQVQPGDLDEIRDVCIDLRAMQ